MEVHWTPIIVAMFSGLGAGIVGSLVAPWAQWKIEETRQRVEARRNFIKTCRAVISTEISSQEFAETAEYAGLRPHISEGLRKKIESDTIQVQLGGRGSGVNNFKAKLLDEVSELEKKWKLI